MQVNLSTLLYPYWPVIVPISYLNSIYNYPFIKVQSCRIQSPSRVPLMANVFPVVSAAHSRHHFFLIVYNSNPTFTAAAAATHNNNSSGNNIPPPVLQHEHQVQQHPYVCLANRHDTRNDITRRRRNKTSFSYFGTTVGRTYDEFPSCP